MPPLSLDHIVCMYPHIIHKVFSFLAWCDLLPIRLVSSGFNDMIEAIIYRHIVLAPSKRHMLLVNIEDPYLRKKLFVLCVGLGCDPKLQAANDMAMVKLNKYTRIVEDSTSNLDHYFEGSRSCAVINRLAELSRKARIARFPVHGLLGTIFQTPRDGHQISFLLTVPKNKAFTYGYDTVTGMLHRGLLPSTSEIFVVVSHSDVRARSSNNWRALFGERLRNVNYSQLTFVGLERLMPQPSSSDVTVLNEIQLRCTPNKSPINFSHLTVHEFQTKMGLSDLQLHMLTTLPGTPLP